MCQRLRWSVCKRMENRTTESILFGFISKYMVLSERKMKAIADLAIFRSAKKGTVLLKKGKLSNNGVLYRTESHYASLYCQQGTIRLLHFVCLRFHSHGWEPWNGNSHIREISKIRNALQGPVRTAFGEKPDIFWWVQDILTGTTLFELAANKAWFGTTDTATSTYQLFGNTTAVIEPFEGKAGRQKNIVLVNLLT